MINSEMEIEKLEVWNGPSRPPYPSPCADIIFWSMTRYAIWFKCSLYLCSKMHSSQKPLNTVVELLAKIKV